ncbi:hypothetical protein K0M31_003747 [Melipona bicolor]|uniref:Uncharacterized protein n=1 Tax=Melipona bicolor TaxID=60889 RepID=A0AA40KNQ0_9HYME|nr:hypothetical protein K0M31_003747 [Melipona bicolor]
MRRQDFRDFRNFRDRSDMAKKRLRTTGIDGHLDHFEISRLFIKTANIKVPNTHFYWMFGSSLDWISVDRPRGFENVWPITRNACLNNGKPESSNSRNMQVFAKTVYAEKWKACLVANAED